MLLKFAPLLLLHRSTRRPVAARHADHAAEIFESRSVLSASAMGALTEDVADCSDMEWEGQLDDESTDLSDADFGANDDTIGDFPLATDGSEAWCFAESDWIGPDAATSDGVLADMLAYSITTEDDVELYSAEIVAIEGDVAEIATDDFVFELDGYLMQRFSGGEDFALADDIVEFYVVDVANLSDMNGDAAVDAADYLAAAAEFGLTGYDSAYDFLIVRHGSDFDIVDIPYGLENEGEGSGIGSELTGLYDAGSLTDGVSDDSLIGGSFADSVFGLSGIDFSSDDDAAFSDSLTSGTSSDVLETVLIVDAETGGLLTEPALDSSRTSFSEQFAEAFSDADHLSNLFNMRMSSIESANMLQLASASDPHQSPEMAALIASFVREQQGQLTSRTSFQIGSPVRSETGEAANVGWLTSTTASLPQHVVFSLADAYSASWLASDTAPLTFCDEAETSNVSTLGEADVAFSYGAGKVLSRLDGNSSNADGSDGESLSYSQMASATGVLLIASSGCVQLSRSNGWWLMWRAFRRSVLAMLRLV